MRKSVAPLRRKLVPLRSDLTPVRSLVASPRRVLIPVLSWHGVGAQIKWRQPINSHGGAAQVSAVL
tara:strand:+ start:2328 stop:2525 length:198 start_codon:yes stop_codon:yes gene_type:complete